MDSDQDENKNHIGGSPSHDDRREKRTSRACLACRKRKSACHLPNIDGVDTTPCERCRATGQECVIGGSNRGGRRVRRKTVHYGSPHADRPSETSLLDSSLNGISESGLVLRDTMPVPPTAQMAIDPALRSGEPGPQSYPVVGATGDSSTSTAIAFDELQNTSDALGILAQIASNGQNAHTYGKSQAGLGGKQTGLQYAPVRDGGLTESQVIQLLKRYKACYHPYFPVVPAPTLEPSNVFQTARDEPHLLTAVLVIASRDLLEEPNLFVVCTEHMRSLVSVLAAGGPGNVEAVEALLLLAEWTPYTSRSDAGHVGRGEEDREAWMHVGTALRIGYYLGLDKYSFTVRGDDIKDPQWQRKRLAWTASYISDRQISIRLGRAFWSRGPGPLTTLRKEDFPMLAPAKPSDEDFASIFQATLELALLFSNVHDVLYSNPGNSMRSHLSGGYIKYIDDFRSAIYGWKSVWGSLTCAPNLKATLLMTYDYLRLYTNAFAFHATVKRAFPQMQGQTNDDTTSQAPGRIFYNNVGAVGDARFIYEGLDAAKSLLSMVNTFVDPEKSLRYMPLRFYLYSIYSGVFLYRARCVGVLASDEEHSVRAMVQETIKRLERSGVGAQHPGSRYAQLLRLLWDRVERKERKETADSTATLQNPYRPGSMGATASASTSSLTEDSPAMTEMIGDFSWTDLDAIGDFAVNGNSGANVGESEWWSGFLPGEANNFVLDSLPRLNEWDLAV